MVFEEYNNNRACYHYGRTDQLFTNILFFKNPVAKQYTDDGRKLKKRQGIADRHMVKSIIGSELHRSYTNDKKAVPAKVAIADLTGLFFKIDSVNKQQNCREKSTEPTPTDKSNGRSRGYNNFLNKHCFNGCQYHCPYPVLYLTFFQ